MHAHHYRAQLTWSGNRGPGTITYESYGRDFAVRVANKPDLPGSADRAFRGDANRHDPEDWLLAALAGCHMLSYLALCARRGVVVVAYEDDALATLVPEAPGRFTTAVLRPAVTVAGSSHVALAQELHAEAHARCFIANSVAFPVTVDATIRSVDAAVGPAA